MTELLSPQQVAEIYGFSVQTLANWRWQGTGPAYIKAHRGPGGRVYYRRADIEAWLQAHTVTSRGGAA